MPFADPATGRVIRDSGRGAEPGKVTLAEACIAGDVLGYSSGWKRAYGLAASIIQGRVVALVGGAIGDVIPVSPNPVVEGYTGATPGNPIYVEKAASGQGKVTETIPAATGDATTMVGRALSATSVLFFINSRADTTSA